MKKINLWYSLWYFLFLISIFLILGVWFKEGKIISNNSEENLNIVSPSRSALHYSTFWYPAGTGVKTPFFISREPAFATLSLLEKAGIPSNIIQAIFLGTIMLIGALTTFYFTRFGLELNPLVAWVSSLFYFLNIYSLTQVWKRFLYNTMISWAYLPLFLMLWLKWITELHFRWLGLFLLSSFFFSYTFSHPAYLFTVWIPATVLVLVRAWDFRKDIRSLCKLVGFSLLSFISWTIVNVWWLYPTLLLSGSWTDEHIPKWDINFNVLIAVSRSFPLNEILLLRQSWYLGHENDWYDFYHNPLVYLISIYVLTIAVLGFIKLKKNKYRKYLAGLALVGLFISKGTNFPLGYIFYYFLFSAFPITAALRNSYEKFGLVWLLPYAVVFSYGVYWLFLKIKNGYKKMLFLAFTLFLSCIVLVYPMWNGDIFPPKHRVEVPHYYDEANDFLNSQNVDRAFHIPFTIEVEKMTYDWGYVGEDPIANIFDQESLTQPGIPLYNKTYKLLSSYFGKKNFSNILGLLGAQYVIFHKDTIYPKIDLIKTQKQIESWQGVSKAETFDKLDLYSLDPKIVKPRIYISGNIIRINSLNEAWDRVVLDEWNRTSIFTLQDIGVELENDTTPQISFTKLSNDRYKVSIRESLSPYILILNNTYDELWKARIDNQIIGKHFIVNGFANGWLIDKNGDYEIEIKLVVWPWD